MNQIPAENQALECPVQSLDTLKERLLELSSYMSWRTIAKTFPGVPVGTLWGVANGRNPRKPAIRRALGLAASVEIEPVPEVEIKPRALVVKSSKLCACGCEKWFVPGHPRQVYLPGHRKHRRINGRG